MCDVQIVARGTTPTQTFIIPIPFSQIADVNIQYNQHAKNVLAKSTIDVTITDNGDNTTKIEFELTQTETLSFDAGYPVEVQIKVYSASGDVLTSCIKHLAISECLNNAIMNYNESESETDA